MSDIQVTGWVEDWENNFVDEGGYGLMFLELKDPEGWWAASVRYDGCINLNRYFNEPNDADPSNTDYIHICDLDDFIERLQALKLLAQVRFGRWPQ